MNTTQVQSIRDAASLRRSEVQFNNAIDLIVAWLDRWFFTPVLGNGGDASDY
jgi:hypothetical protein